MKLVSYLFFRFNPFLNFNPKLSRSGLIIKRERNNNSKLKQRVNNSLNCLLDTQLYLSEGFKGTNFSSEPSGACWKTKTRFASALPEGSPKHPASLKMIIGKLKDRPLQSELSLGCSDRGTHKIIDCKGNSSVSKTPVSQSECLNVPSMRSYSKIGES